MHGNSEGGMCWVRVYVCLRLGRSLGGWCVRGMYVLLQSNHVCVYWLLGVFPYV
jgi:hypothetical protein